MRDAQSLIPSFVRQTRPALLPLSLAAALWVITDCMPAWTQAAPAPAAQPGSHNPDAAVNEKVHLQGESLTLPLVLIKGYPFLQGEINGTAGKLLFDIGEEASFALDSHRIQPPDGKEIGKGFFGSGQTFSVYRFPVVDHLKLAGGPEYTAIPTFVATRASRSSSTSPRTSSAGSACTGSTATSSNWTTRIPASRSTKTRPARMGKAQGCRRPSGAKKW